MDRRPTPLLLIVLIFGVAVVMATGVAAAPSRQGDTVKKVKAPCIGIDFGHDSFAVGVWQDGEAKLLPDEETAQVIMPTVVHFDGLTADSTVVGREALHRLVTHPAATTRDIHLLLGRNGDDEVVTELSKRAAYQIRSQGDARSLHRLQVEFDTDGGPIRSTPEQIAAMFLKRAKKRAEQFLRRKVLNVVVALPAGFGGGVRQALNDTAVMAGVKIVRFINEPTAAMLAYGLHRVPGERHVAIVHIGATELTVSVATSGNGFTEVLKSLTDAEVSTQAVANKTAVQISKLLHKKLSMRRPMSTEEIARVTAEIRHHLPDVFKKGQVELKLPALREWWNFEYTLTRKSLEAVAKPFLDKVTPLLQRTLREAKLTVDKIDEYVVVGTLARSPQLKDALKEFFGGKEPNRGLDPDEVVGLGAVVQAATLTGQVELSK